MGITLKKNKAVLDTVVTIDDVEPLLDWLQKSPKGKVDLRACTHLHAAVLQLILLARPEISAWPEDTDLRNWLHGALASPAAP